MTQPTISPVRLSELCKAGRVALIDVRTPMEFREVHIEQARNIPLDQLNPADLGESMDSPVYVICRSGSRGRKACEKFLAAGYTNVFNVDGGTLACIDAGLPVVRGKKSVSLERQVRMAAGSLILLGAILGWLVHPAFYLLPALVGCGLIFSGLTDTCGMGMLLARMPWNRVGGEGASCCSSKETCS